MTTDPNPGRAVTLAVLGLSSMTIMANATVASSLPGLRAHYADVPHIDTLAGLIVTLPSLAIVLSPGIMGLLIDRWDRQKLLLVTALLYAVGGTSGLWAESIWGLLAGRLALGLGVAGTMNLGMTWASDLCRGPSGRGSSGGRGRRSRWRGSSSWFWAGRWPACTGAGPSRSMP